MRRYVMYRPAPLPLRGSWHHASALAPASNRGPRAPRRVECGCIGALCIDPLPAANSHRTPTPAIRENPYTKPDASKAALVGLERYCQTATRVTHSIRPDSAASKQPSSKHPPQIDPEKQTAAAQRNAATPAT
jgi:hypothetical protein